MEVNSSNQQGQAKARNLAEQKPFWVCDVPVPLVVRCALIITDHCVLQLSVWLNGRLQPRFGSMNCMFAFWLLGGIVGCDAVIPSIKDDTTTVLPEGQFLAFCLEGW